MHRIARPSASLSAAAAALCSVALGLGAPVAHASSSANHYRLTYAKDALGVTRLVRWSPCTTIAGVTRVHVIHYRVHSAGVDSRVTLARHAVGKLAAATGLRFHYDGQTGYIPQGKSVGGAMRLMAASQRLAAHGAQLVVAWAARGTGPGESNLLTKTEAGVGSISWASSVTSQLRIDDAGVVIKRGLRLRGGFQPGGSIGTLLLHELGHAVGLRHVTDEQQAMYPVIGPSSPGGYAAGDATGLAKVGFAWTRCLTTPPLPPLDP